MIPTINFSQTAPSPDAPPAQSLENCLALAQNVEAHDQATEQFQELRTDCAQDASQAQAMIDMLWWELLRARRSAQFWQKTCDIERELTERMAASHFQLQQNYLRLVQEQ
ncbi:MAG: hypothetical protein ACO3NK_09880 [Prochlorotrichaceae cyanobacterium]|jgi:hypothetical protein